MTTARSTLFAITMATALCVPAGAQQACPCVPVTKLWVSRVCDTWNCATSALISANGDPMTFAIPVGAADGRWIVIQQVTAGGYTDSSPFQVESFDGVADASARFSAITNDFSPHIMSSPDGKFLVISLRTPEVTPAKRRSAGH